MYDLIRDVDIILEVLLVEYVPAEDDEDLLLLALHIVLPDEALLHAYLEHDGREAGVLHRYGDEGNKGDISFVE